MYVFHCLFCYYFAVDHMVSVAQLAELWIVAPAAGGSNPLAHPILFPKVPSAS